MLTCSLSVIYSKYVKYVKVKINSNIIIWAYFYYICKTKIIVSNRDKCTCMII